ncbi:cinnamoyl-CoA reductase 1-like [Selaginella moellendorffii]|uniref:cinnamoyl-CoA reductase 1-like n=1 Tax=Selaginella moellendorffii TaxID=88036 RepID=UPI000D1C41BB|nr:cinnamoyl-CoA reductase 1-like [Selaginella moellendorffii]|eukprot:XP_024516399.1 cinnamoyl-CoA reductase 1-like [Selaginella moellendorffii]
MGKIVCVTGANGFIASWIVCKLLQRGYTVRGTVRNPEKCGHLLGLDGAKERLTLFKADLLSYESLLPAFRGCYGVFHTACPVAFQFDNPDDVLGPAIQGTENVMAACSNEKVQRVVMTSSGAAIVADPNRPKDKVVDESCWSDSEACKERKSWYSLAKTESEKLAWKFAKEKGLDLIVICPVMVFGPILQPTSNTTVEALKNIIKGSSIPNSWVRLVDVRDVAESHIVALENEAASGRYFCFAHCIHYKDVVSVLAKKFPQHCNPELQCDESQPVGGIAPELAKNDKLLSLIKETIPYEQTLIDTISCLDDKGFM